MGKIKKILENELIGGTQNTDVYPVTSTKAVYDTSNKVLDDYIQHLKKTSTFAGIATPTTNPGTPDGPVFYLASESGTYSNFNGISVADGEVVILQWDNGAWTKKTTGFASEQEIIYDVSAHNGGVVFESLSALLGSTDLSTLIPTSVRHGGMSIRFIQGSVSSSDNNYVQYRYMETDVTTAATFTNVSNWQGVDEEPIANSKNLVESGGVEKRVSLVDVSKQPRVKGFNLFNADFGETEIPGMYFDKNIKGYQFDKNGNYYANANIGISHLIEVKAETKYYSVFSFSSANNRVMFYDKDLNLISTTQPDDKQFTTPEQCKYIRFCFVWSSIKAYTYAEGNIAYNYEPYYNEPYNVLLSDFTTYSIASGNIGIKRVGDRYYKSDEKKLYLCTEYTSATSFVAQEEKMTADKVYLYNGQSYIYNGKELIRANKIIELADITSEIRRSGKVQVSKVGDIYYYMPSNVFYIVTSFTNVLNFEVAIYNMPPGTTVRYKNTLFMKDAVKLSKIEDVFIAPTIKTTAASVTQGNSIYISTLPNIKQGKIYHFSADVSGTTRITITHSSNAYAGGGLIIKNSAYRTRNFRTLEWSNDIPLGFTLANNVSVTIKQNEKLHVAECTITSTTGSITVEIPWNGSEGHFVAYMSEGAITNAVLSVSFFDVQKDVWLFGDSYFDIWTMTLAEKVNNNYMLDAYSGRNSNQAMNSLKLDLKYATPKVIVWCMGMNDPDTDSSTINASYKANLDMLISMCNNLGIKLYVTTIPLVPSQYNNAKNAYIESVAPNVVDVNHIVGGDVSTSWYSGLQLDGIHPTELGGKVICNYICACVSEL